MKNFEKISQRIDSYEKAMIELQGTLTAIPALSPVNGGEGEVKKAEAIVKFLKGMNFSEILELNAPDSSAPCGYRPNIIALYKGKSDKKTIWIMSHMDVVPPGDLNMWETDPYKIEVKEGKIYGRGTEDNQQSLVASIFALKAFIDEGLVPEYDTGLVFVADEETGSQFGLGHVLKEYKNFRHEDYILVPDSGNCDGSMIEVAEKSILWIQFTTTGKQCHASRPSKGINSFRAASHLVVKLNELYNIYPKVNNLFDPPISTFEPTKKEGNVPNINTIPGKDVFCLDCRILPEYPLEDVIETIRNMCNDIEKTFDVKIEMDFPNKEEAAPPTHADSPVVKAVSESIRSVHRVEPVPMGIGGGTVAALFRKAGFSAVCCSKHDELAHQPNEYCRIRNMIDEAKMFAHLMLQE